MSASSIDAIYLRWGAAFLMTYVALDLSYAPLLDPASNTDSEASVVETKPGMNTPSLPVVLPYTATGAAAAPTPTGKAGSIILADDLSSNGKHLLPATSSQPEKYSAGYTDSGYALSQTAVPAPVGGLDQPEVNVPGNYADVSISVDASLINPADDQYFNIACRSQDAGSQYRLSVRPTLHEFQLNRYTNGTAVGLIGTLTSSAIRDGSQTNRLELTCQGTAIEASINGVQLVSLSDPEYSAGGLWMGAGQVPPTGSGSATAIGSPIAVRFTNLVVTQR